MADEIKESALVERVRQAVIKRGCTVTIGDIISETGLSADDAKSGLDKLIATHEGTLRVSERGELLYAFSRGVIRRDQRSWWERNKAALFKILKLLFKIIIMLTLVIYFIIYMVIIIALLSSNRNDRSSSGSGDLFMWGIYLFWGRGDSTYDRRERKKDPLYTRVYRFVFGPEEEPLDPLEAKTKCAQLIRARNGVITVEDWMMISGQTREKCESDLARYTAEFGGEAEISKNGTLLYVFEDVMKSTGGKKQPMPLMAWNDLEHPRPLSGNVNGGNGAVIGLNSFNLIMSFVMMYGISSYMEALQVQAMSHGDFSKAQTLAMLDQSESTYFWLGLVPFIFSTLIFAGPLVRLPFNIKENNARRKRSMRKAAMSELFSGKSSSAGVNAGNTQIAQKNVENSVNRRLKQVGFNEADSAEIKGILADLSDELGGEMTGAATPTYAFKEMDERMKEAEYERQNRSLDRQQLGRVIFSTDNREQDKCEDNENAADLDEFDRALRENASYDTNYSRADGAQTRGHRSSGR